MIDFRGGRRSRQSTAPGPPARRRSRATWRCVARAARSSIRRLHIPVAGSNSPPTTRSRHCSNPPATDPAVRKGRQRRQCTRRRHRARWTPDRRARIENLRGRRCHRRAAATSRIRARCQHVAARERREIAQYVAVAGCAAPGSHAADESPRAGRWVVRFRALDEVERRVRRPTGYEHAAAREPHSTVKLSADVHTSGRRPRIGRRIEQRRRIEDAATSVSAPGDDLPAVAQSNRDRPGPDDDRRRSGR